MHDPANHGIPDPHAFDGWDELGRCGPSGVLVVFLVLVAGIGLLALAGFVGVMWAIAVALGLT